MKKILVVVLGLTMFFLSGCSNKKNITIEFINSSDISLIYKLMDDNINAYIEYGNFLKRDLENGYVYHTSNNSESYYFLHLNYSSDLVMSYYSFSNIDNDSGNLFGIRGGSVTNFKGNKTLGIKSYSLIKYLFDKGFRINTDRGYVKSSYCSVNDHYINWHYFIKDDVFINIALETNDTLNLAAFEIGINHEMVIDKLVKNKKGYSIDFIDSSLNYNNLKTIESNFLIHLKLYKKFDSVPNLNVNGELIDKFRVTSEKIYEYELYYLMPNKDIIIDIR